MNDTQVPKQYETVAEAAQRAKIGMRTLRRWIAEGRVTAYRFGPRLVRLDPAEVDALLSPIPTVGTVTPVDRRAALRREADEIAARRADSICAHPSKAAAEAYMLVDCEVCAGGGAMTARPADNPTALPALIPCPACNGQGGKLRPLSAVGGRDV